MEFVILRDAEVTFSGRPSSEEGFQKRVSKVLDVEIQPTWNDDDGTNNKNYSEQLTSAVIEDPWNFKRKNTKIDWNLQVAVSLPEPKPIQMLANDVGNNGLAADKTEVRLLVHSESDQSFLRILHDTFNVRSGNGLNVTMNVVVKDFGLKLKSLNNPSSIGWRADELALNDNKVLGNKFTESHHVHQVPNPDERMFLAWKDGQEFSGIFTIYVVLSYSALNLLNSWLHQVPGEGFGHFKRMLENEICADLEIHVGFCPENQKVIKCHRAILAAGSEVFERMFANGMKEATENKIEIEGMSEAGVRAMLAYLYYWDITAAYASSDIAMELLQAGEKYDIQGLKDTVREYMMSKEYRWFAVDMVLALFLFVRTLCPDYDSEILDMADDYELRSKVIKMETDQSVKVEDDEEIKAWRSLKIKCLKVLKWYMEKKPNKILDSAKYQEMFVGNLKLVMEVTSGILRLK